MEIKEFFQKRISDTFRFQEGLVSVIQIESKEGEKHCLDIIDRIEKGGKATKDDIEQNTFVNQRLQSLRWNLDLAYKNISIFYSICTQFGIELELSDKQKELIADIQANPAYMFSFSVNREGSIVARNPRMDEDFRQYAKMAAEQTDTEVFGKAIVEHYKYFQEQEKMYKENMKKNSASTIETSTEAEIEEPVAEQKLKARNKK